MKEIQFMMFTIPGNYTVNLTAINGNGTDSKLATINVTEKPILPVANFSTNVSEGYAPLYCSVYQSVRKCNFCNLGL